VQGQGAGTWQQKAVCEKCAHRARSLATQTAQNAADGCPHPGARARPAPGAALLGGGGLAGVRHHEGHGVLVLCVVGQLCRLRAAGGACGVDSSATGRQLPGRATSPRLLPCDPGHSILDGPNVSSTAAQARVLGMMRSQHVKAGLAAARARTSSEHSQGRRQVATLDVDGRAAAALAGARQAVAALEGARQSAGSCRCGQWGRGGVVSVGWAGLGWELPRSRRVALRYQLQPTTDTRPWHAVLWPSAVAQCCGPDAAASRCS
jgi:hypothetical protein